MRLLRHLVSISIVNGVKRVPFFNGQAAEEFVDLETLRKSVAAVPPEQRTDDDRTNISLLETAIERKAEGKPYSRIRASADDF